MNKISLVKSTIDNNEIDSLIGWLKGYPKLTKGDLTVEFEKKWSKFIGVDYSIFVNSGSSANLLMTYVLLELNIIKRGDFVVIPSLSWSTTLSPVIQFGLNPILCDCNLDDLSIDINHFEKIISECKPKVLILVPILGFVPDMEKISKICKSHNIILLEDSCESLGSKFFDKNLGTFGLISSFSTYFGHHISTIEGGMICTNDKKMANVLKSLRSHGWDRDMDNDYSLDLRKKYNLSSFNDLYTFYHTGFNVRSTDLQAFLGIGQLDKLSMIIENRNKNYELYKKFLNNNLWKPKDKEGSFVSNFAYPVISENRQKIADKLKENDIECRPLLSGSLSQQPYWFENFGHISLKNCDYIHHNGMYVPNNHELTESEIFSICDIINKNS